MKLDELKQGFSSLWESVADGWQRLHQSAAGAADDNTLVVRGEKRFERESTRGRYRVLQCAYGSFRRAVPLPAGVLGDNARASYRNGVLRIELPKATPGKPKSVTIRVA